MEIVQRFFDAFNNGDIEAELAQMDPGIEFDWSASHSPYQGRYRGHAKITRRLHEVRDAWDEMRFDPQGFTEVEDRYVVVDNRVRGRGRASGLEVVAEGAQVWTFEHGSAVRVQLYQSKEEALAALGAGAP